MKFLHENLIRIATIYLVAFIMVLGISTTSANAWSQSERINLNARNVDMVQLFEMLQKQTSLKFVFQHEDVERYIATVDAENMTLSEILDAAFTGKPLTYRITDEHVIISRAETGRSSQQNPTERIVLNGEVKDAKGKPVVGASVANKATGTGVPTDANGRFRINVERNTGSVTTLVISHIGFETQEIAVAQERTLNVVLAESNTKIQDVTVRSIFNRNKGTMTGSMTDISREELDRHWNRDILGTITNIEPSLRMVENNYSGSNPNALPELNLRGETELWNFEQLRNRTGTQVNTPYILLDGMEITLERMRDLNEDEIENITILKDASATAIYGHRGANGVILITSKIPEGGGLLVSYKGNLSLQVPALSSYNLLNARQKLEIEAAAGQYDSNPQAYQTLLNAVNNGTNTNWLKYPTRTAIGQRHSLSISGGDEVYRYSLVLGLNNNPGVMKGSSRRTINATANLIYAKGNLMMSNAMNISTTDAKESPYGSFTNTASLNPYWTPKDENGEWNKTFDYMGAFTLENHVYNASLRSFNKSQSTVMSNNFSLNYWLFDKALNLSAKATISRSLQTSDNFISPLNTIFRNTETNRSGTYSKSNTKTDKWDISFIADFSKTFNERHMLSAGASARAYSSYGDTYSVYARGFLNEALNHISNALGYNSSSDSPSGKEDIRHTAEVVTNVNYSYDMRYFVDASLNYGGASTFGRNSRWSEFWSIGAGWNAHEEKWFRENVPFINFLKVKYSYGVSGSMNFSPYEGNFIFQYSIEDHYNNLLGTSLMQFGNTNLKWSQTYQHDAGITMELFDGIVQLQGSYFRKMTNDATNQMSLGLSHGFDAYTGNVGKILNHGWEGRLTVYFLRSDDWTLSFMGNISRQDNKVMKLSQEMKKMIEEMEAGNKGANQIYTYREGYSTKSLWVFQSLGVDPISGKRVYVMSDGTPTLDATQLDNARIYVGNTVPKANGYFSFSMLWKDLSVTMGFSYGLGGKAYNNTIANKVEYAEWQYNFDRRVYTDRWRSVGDYAIYRDIRDNSTPYINNQFVQTNNYLQWASLNISYSLNREWTKRNLGIKRLMVGMDLSDLWYKATIRRERGVDYPYSINPNFRLTASF